MIIGFCLQKQKNKIDREKVFCNTISQNFLKKSVKNTFFFFYVLKNEDVDCFDFV